MVLTFMIHGVRHPIQGRGLCLRTGPGTKACTVPNLARTFAELLLGVFHIELSAL